LKITIDVPDIFPANFMRPSLELLCFIKQFQDLCLEISDRYRDIRGDELFVAYIRNGWNTVLNTDDPEKCYMLQLPDEDEREGEERERVVMDEDHLGDWVVARLCVGNWKYDKQWRVQDITLRSSDFESHGGKPPRAQVVMQRIVKQLARKAHTVPRSS
jgi:hypothetical protein